MDCRKKYILNKKFTLRGWKNIPYSIDIPGSPGSPIVITPELTEKLSTPFEYDSGDTMIDRMIRQGIVVPCSDGEVLADEQKYKNYGCLHFESVIFSITGRCNYKCMHCSVNAPDSPMTEIPFERICSLLDEMKECGLKNVVLIGGEPLIRKDFLKIADEVIKRGMFIAEIFTNGSLVTPKLLDELDRHGIKTLFMISFDGVGYHDRMRGVKGAEENFYKCVKLLKERGYPVNANMCITRESIYSLWDTIRTLSDLGVGSLTVYPPVECGLWEDKAETLGVTTQMIGDEYPKVIEKYVAAGYPITLNMYGLIYFSSELKKYALTPKWKAWGKNPEKVPACITFTSELNISPEGILSPCYALMSDPFSKDKMPDINKMSLKDALTDSPFVKIMEMTSADVKNHNSKCSSCEHFLECGGGCRLSAYKHTGDFYGYDPQMCEFFEKGYDKRFREAVKNGIKKTVWLS